MIDSYSPHISIFTPDEIDIDQMTMSTHNVSDELQMYRIWSSNFVRIWIKLCRIQCTHVELE